MRTISGMMLTVAIGLAAGCGGSNPTAEPPPKATTTEPVPAPGPNPKDPDASDSKKPNNTKPVDPSQPPPPVTWEMDLTKHAIPKAPVSGKFHGQAFLPDVLIEGSVLTFQMMDEKDPIGREVTIFLPLPPGKTPEGLPPVLVAPDKPTDGGTPVVTFRPPLPGVGGFADRGFALTLKLGKRDHGTLSGEIYLSLPGETKDAIAGTFQAEWLRTATEPPGADDVPFVSGPVSIPYPTPEALATAVGYPAASFDSGPIVQIGYARPDAGDKPAFDLVGLGFSAPGLTARSRQKSHRPQAIRLVAGAGGHPGSYELTRLAPGRYLVFASTYSGPTTWKWVTVAADSKLAVDFAIDMQKVGALEVAVPPELVTAVAIAPADDTGKPWPPAVLAELSRNLNLQAIAKDGKVSFTNLGPGKYEIRSGDLTATAEVKAGETAKVTLMPMKK